jgi:hypothetical protein
MIPALAVAEELAGRFARRMPVKTNGTSGSFSWQRGDHRPPARRFEPAKGFRGGRRNDGVSWAMWAYHAALGDPCQLRTIVAGKRRTYDLLATPEEGLGYLMWQAYRPGFNPGRGTARQYLTAYGVTP